MSIEFKNAPTGYYTTFHIISIAQMQMPEEYDALLDPSELVWEDVSVAGFYDKALFVGYINIAPAGICKVLACMTSDGAIQFYTRGGLRLPRTDNGRIQLVAPWTYLAEDIERRSSSKSRRCASSSLRLPEYQMGW
jgi:hypothetical protein